MTACPSPGTGQVHWLHDANLPLTPPLLYHVKYFSQAYLMERHRKYNASISKLNEVGHGSCEEWWCRNLAKQKKARNKPNCRAGEKKQSKKEEAFTIVSCFYRIVFEIVFLVPTLINGTPRLLPRKLFSCQRVLELSRRPQSQVVGALDQPSCTLSRRNNPSASPIRPGHVCLHKSRVEDKNADALWLQVQGQTLASDVQSAFAHPVPIRPAGGVVLRGSHPRGDKKNLLV